MKKLVLGGLLAVILLYLGNFYVAVLFSGMNPLHVQMFEDSEQDIPAKYRVFLSTKDNRPILGYAQRNSFGIWRVLLNSHKYYWEYDSEIISWATFHDYPMRIVYHQLIYGENADQELSFPAENLPDNVEIDIHQTGQIFFIHIKEIYLSGRSYAGEHTFYHAQNVIEYLFPND